MSTTKVEAIPAEVDISDEIEDVYENADNTHIKPLIALEDLKEVVPNTFLDENFKIVEHRLKKGFKDHHILYGRFPNLKFTVDVQDHGGKTQHWINLYPKFPIGREIKSNAYHAKTYQWNGHVVREYEEQVSPQHESDDSYSLRLYVKNRYYIQIAGPRSKKEELYKLMEACNLDVLK